VTVLAAMQSAAVRLMGQRPTGFFGASGSFEAEMSDLVNEVATDVAKYQDWQALVRVGTVTGDGTLTQFDLPDDYDRMLGSSAMQDLTSWFWGFGAYTDINSFLYDEARGFSGFPGGWIIYGNQLRFSPAPSDAQVATFPYITQNWAVDASTAAKGAFTADTDSFALPERLLTLGLVWRWRENKKLDSTGDQEAFIKALDEYAAKDRGARVYRKRARRAFPGTYTAWPWELGPSTYIDS
jgi:hypothetical protein